MPRPEMALRNVCQPLITSKVKQSPAWGPRRLPDLIRPARAWTWGSSVPPARLQRGSSEAAAGSSNAEGGARPKPYGGVEPRKKRRRPTMPADSSSPPFSFSRLAHRTRNLAARLLPESRCLALVTRRCRATMCCAPPSSPAFPCAFPNSCLLGQSFFCQSTAAAPPRDLRRNIFSSLNVAFHITGLLSRHLEQ